MFKKVMVANRAAAASRVLRALRKLNIPSVAIYSEADADLAYVAEADEARCVGPAPSAQSYLDQARIIAVAKECGVDGLHPGYGFLSENAAFAAAVEEAGIRFIGPAAQWIEAMGHKAKAREKMTAHGMPMTPSSDILPADPEAARAIADALGYPLMIKPVAGGGGIGMTVARTEEEFIAGYGRARDLAARSFGEGAVYLERLIDRPRHVEFQILADKFGGARHLFERDCSIQRRNQKVIEEAPAPNLPGARAMADRVGSIIGEMGYSNIGTVETLYDGAAFQFLEMNTRLQVEHAVTEAITGIDIVTAQIRLAAGEKIEDVLPATITASGHAIEARIYAEDPLRFLPSPGKLAVFQPPKGEGVRVETGYREGNVVTPYYDPMVAKVIAWGPTRAEAISRLGVALRAFDIQGIKTNIPFILAVLDDAEFAAGRVHTGLGTMVQDGLKAAAKKS